MSTNAMHVAKTGLNAQQTRMQVIANNLANVNTTGFKRDRANFETLLYQSVRAAGSPTSDGTQSGSAFAVGTGVRVLSTEKSFTQGNMVNTDNALDVAIDGQGFFQVLMPDGQIGYTRDGSFALTSDGTLSTDSGYIMQPEMAIPQGAMEISVSSDGIVSVKMPGQIEMQEVGQITLANFVNPRGLDPVGENFLVETPASGPPVIGPPVADGAGRLVQGALEALRVTYGPQDVARFQRPAGVPAMQMPGGMPPGMPPASKK